jgi:hypothetical protein
VVEWRGLSSMRKHPRCDGPFECNAVSQQNGGGGAVCCCAAGGLRLCNPLGVRLYGRGDPRPGGIFWWSPPDRRRSMSTAPPGLSLLRRIQASRMMRSPGGGFTFFSGTDEGPAQKTGGARRDRTAGC